MIQTLTMTACNDSGLLHAFFIIKNVINLIKVLIPVVLIIMGMIDMFKAVISSDEKEMKVAQNHFIKRTMAAVVIFFIPIIINFSFSTFTELELEYADCLTAATQENIELLKAEEEKAREAEKQKRMEKNKEKEEKNNNSTNDTNNNDNTSDNEPISGADKLRQQVITEAIKYSIAPSHPYVWGGTKLCDNWQTQSGCGVDCSGFVQAIYKKFHFNIPRNSSAQSVYSGGQKIEDFGNNYSNLKPGDLVFYKKDGKTSWQKQTS